MPKLELSEDEWQQKLTAEQYYILRKKGTERPFTGNLLKNKGNGTYVCAGCNSPLFKSDKKYESGSGWPSFFDTDFRENIEEEADKSLGMVRTEVKCSNCGSHLGHLFNDGPNPTGMRYCINSASMNFEEE